MDQHKPLKQLLRCSATVRPQHRCPGQRCSFLSRLGCGKARVNAEQLVVIFCTAPSSSTWQSLPHQKALKLLSVFCFPECCPSCAEQKSSYPQLVCKSFVSKGSASSVPQGKIFPWFDLTAAQLRHLETVLHRNSSAVVEPGVKLDGRSSFSAAASGVFSEIPEETAGYDSKSS
ncbi:PREDICTED: NADP-dependent oxidoreductase domain-containing protein 1 [Apaloderma vittatum]|uniref:NADP-dependent oxidoreductase domain-containing protein 1 n=1 Tax=Apaloderma vittatum TaxID=57397 RepID=UPI000521CA52|nr:PREDICTED: NADP-dependent oxidoreductase domain-containing protein 1 [Apaloderma vittatum]